MKNLTKRPFSGIRQRHVNEVVWNIYGYKFYNNEACLDRLISFATEDLQDEDFDIIVPIQPRNSGSDIVRRLAVVVSNNLNKELCDILSSTNSSVTDKTLLRGKTILIIDDVYYTGKTTRKAEKALQRLKPKKIVCYALAKSTNSKL